MAGAISIFCPACGVGFAVPLGTAVARCPGCGKLTRPAAMPIDDPPADDIGFAFTASPVVRRRAKRNSVAWPVVAAVVVIGAIIGATAVILITMPTTPKPAVVAWDRANRESVAAIKADAERLAVAGQFRQSLAAYQRLTAAVGSHDINDPVMVELIAGARAGQDRVFAKLMSESPATQPAPVVVPHSTTAAVVTETPTTGPVAAIVPTMEPVVVTPSPPTTGPVSPAAAVTTAPVDLLPAVVPNPADTAPPLAGATAPKPPHGYPVDNTVTDEQIGDAIDNGIRFLRSRFKRGEILTGLNDQFRAPTVADARGIESKDPVPTNLPDEPKPPVKPTDPGPDPAGAGWASAASTPGYDALCVYALLHAGQATDPRQLGPTDPFTIEILARLKQYRLRFTYHRSLRAAALAVHGRSEDMPCLEDDVRWLVDAHVDGAYTYTKVRGTVEAATWDNSNSQYGLLGVWAGAQAGIAVPVNYWAAVDRHWAGCAIDNGQWPYSAGAEGTLSMTCAGVASMMVSRDFLDKPADPVGRAMAWLDQGDNCMRVTDTRNLGSAAYTLYGLERVGLATGFKYFGKHDWYAELARQIVNEQHADGSWGPGGTDTLLDTAYSLLFLARGRSPILFNKLRYNGDWAVHPRDTAHLAAFAAKQLERPLNHQVVNLRVDWFDWLDAPVLYIAGDIPPVFSDRDYDGVRQFAEAGGLVFCHADRGSPSFDAWVRQAAHRMFPRYELTPVPDDHPLYSIVYPIKSHPPLSAVSNGSRVMLIDCPRDVAAGWQLNWTDTNRDDFRLGVNLFAYAGGKAAGLKNRLLSTYIPPPPTKPVVSDVVSVLRYPGAWNPEPYAWTRFSRFYQWETRRGLSPTTVDLRSLEPGASPMAVLTGTVANDFTAAEAASARAYVEGGGVLVVDACGGQAEFARSVESTLITPAFPGAKLDPLSIDHPALVPARPGADDCRNLVYRTVVGERNGRQPLLGFSFGKGRVIYSRLDLTTGLLGTQSYGVMGFDATYAQGLMKNIVLWSAARSGRISLPQPRVSARD